tara:strand:- start:185 stop:469 length:285 start_codon:yes stop_codon:yes gene_type:complete
MKVQSCSLTVDALKGAIVSYADGTEIGHIVDVSFNLDHHAVVVMIRQEDNGISGIPWQVMKDYRISLQPESWTDNVDLIAGKVSEAVEHVVENI